MKTHSAKQRFFINASNDDIQMRAQQKMTCRLEVVAHIKNLVTPTEKYDVHDITNDIYQVLRGCLARDCYHARRFLSKKLGGRRNLSCYYTLK